MWWRGDIAGAPERARWAGARALCRVLRRVRDLLARGGGYRWIRGPCYCASIFCHRGIRVCFLVVLLCERIVYVWLPYACVCAGVEGSHALFACAFACVCMRMCACACACVSSCKMRACVLVLVHACGVLFVSVKKHSRALGRLCMSVCARVRARACVGGPTSVVRDVVSLTVTLTPRVRVCVCAGRAEHGG